MVLILFLLSVGILSWVVRKEPVAAATPEVRPAAGSAALGLWNLVKALDDPATLSNGERKPLPAGQERAAPEAEGELRAH